MPTRLRRGSLATRLTNAPFISIASIRGRTRGGGDELALASDLRYASREEAIFRQPEAATGLLPGGGGSDRLPRLIGRDRALEAIITSQGYDADGPSTTDGGLAVTAAVSVFLAAAVVTLTTVHNRPHQNGTHMLTPSTTPAAS